MKKLLFLVIAALFFSAAEAKEKNLEEMTEKKRNEYLIKIAKETVMQHGPGYYREVAPPVIKRYTVNADTKDVVTSIREKNPGRIYYTVGYPYDDTQETFDMEYAAHVFIWGNTGVAFQVDWGNGVGRAHLDNPEIWTGKEPKAKVQKSPPRKKNNNQP